MGRSLFVADKDVKGLFHFVESVVKRNDSPARKPENDLDALGLK
jgi:hypothetical protein